MAVEEIAKACASSALILMIQELGTLPIQLFGSDELKERFLPQVRQRRVVAGLRPLRARGGQRPGGDAHHRRPRRRRVGDQRPEELDHQRLASPTSTSSSPSPTARTSGSAPSWSRKSARASTPASSSTSSGSRARRPARPSFTDVRVPHENLIGDRGQGPQRRPRHARAHPPRRRRPGGRDRPGGDRLRQRVREGADRLRQADQRPAGDPVQARRHGDRHRRRPRAALQSLLDGRPRPSARPTSASGPRWRSCSPPTTR